MRGWLWAVPPDNYPIYVRTETFAVRRVGRAALEQICPGDTIFAYLSGSKVIAGMFEAVGEPFRDSTALVAGGGYRHRVRVRPVVLLSEEAWLPYEAFHEKLTVVEEYNHFRAVVQQVVHPLPKVDEKVLEFLVRARQAVDMEMEKVMAAYDAYLRAKAGRQEEDEATVREAVPSYEAQPFDCGSALEALLRYVAARGFVYEPWQVAAYVAALRTKPFVILAGVTGTGKSKLPALVEEATGGRSRLVPVRPDWTDSADVLGYLDLQSRFRPGAVLEAARAAVDQPTRHFTCLVDEMNLARVEQYLAEVLSRIEDRRPAPRGGYESPPLLEENQRAAAPVWSDVRLAPNFALVGTVNMDESAHGFSRKVLDRAFTLELADVDLTALPAPPEGTPEAARWPASAWYPRATRLGALEGVTENEQAHIDRAVEALAEANRFLAPAQLQVAYRTRDEVALFLLHAADHQGAFRTRGGEAVDPLDLALHMKVLPRLAGGSRPLRRALLGLLGWATSGAAFGEDEDARPVLDAWEAAGRPNCLPAARFPRTAARLCLMWERLLAEGFTSFWL